MFTLRTIALTAVALVAGAGLRGVAQAGEGHGCSHAYSIQYVTVYETIKKPYVAYITKFDECGHPYQVKVVDYKLVKVAVRKPVRVAL